MKKPELLAPAGSIESFHAAIDAGANAVYLGLGDFNARLRAKNFTAQNLCGLVPYAHSRNVKVYVTVNTLIKQSEIKPVLDLLYQLEQIGIDAVIVADIGLMKLASTHFPNLKLHGSTQMTVHNADGAEFLKTLGAKRVVLARELTLEEIRETVKKSPIDIEVFIHGALCYSISGQCLASSFIGGASGNRGKCTQVCRRRFKYGERVSDINGYFFSPYDLQGISHVGKLIDAGVGSFKIEGRMKGAEYVGTVVKAYRHAIDFPEDVNLNQIIEDLRFDFGREKTSFYIDGCKGKIPIDPSRPSGTGIIIGTIIERDDAAFTVRRDADAPAITKGDRLRVQPESGFEGTACKVGDCKISGDDMIITPSTPVKCDIGDYIFYIGKTEQNAKSNHSKNIAAASPQKKIEKTFPLAHKIANSLTPPPVNTNIISKNKPKLWFKVDKTDWFDLLNASPCTHLIFDADTGEINKLIDTPNLIKTWRSRIFIALPPFIECGKLKIWHDLVEKCLSAGLQSFTISNPGHFALVKNKNIQRLIADNPLWCLNRFTQKVLEARGVNKFVISYEDEYLNIRDAAAVSTGAKITGIAPVYGIPPLFISRMPPAIDCGVVTTDPHDNKFFVNIKNNLYYTLPQLPMCLFAKREKLASCGIEDFLIDISFHEPSYDIVNELVSGFRAGVRVKGGTIFNFKAGLR